MKKKITIGIFDSGIGGLTVLKSFKKILPSENYVYFGDTARVPYGSKSETTIQIFASEIIDFLIEQKANIIVVACNTVSSLALPYLQKKYQSVPIFGVVKPGSREALRKSKKQQIGVIGTVATVNSHNYTNTIKAYNKKALVYEQACPLFVPLVENGWANNEVALLTAQKYLTPLLKKNIDTLVLGCTHYPVLKKIIKKIIGKDINIVDSATAIAKEVKDYLVENKTLSTSKKTKTQFWLSDKSIYFIKAAKYILNENITIKVKKL